MAKALSQILGYEALTEIVTTPTGGVPNIWPKEFLSIKKPIKGNVATWQQVGNTRQNALGTNYGSASRRIDKEAIGSKTATMCHVFNDKMHGAAVLEAVRSFDSPEAQNFGQQIIDLETAEFRRRMENNRISSISSMLRYGAIYQDGGGRLLHSSSGATQTIDLGVSATHKDQLGGLVGLWSTAGTDILSQLTALEKAAIQESGRPLRYAFYGSAIPGYFRANTQIAAQLDQNRMLAEALGSGKIPNDFGIPGLIWLPCHLPFFTDDTGTVREWFPSDFVVFMPEVTRDWYELQEGSYPVPKELSVTADANSARSGFESVNGMFSFAQQSSNPAGIQHFMGDTFLPVLKDPSCLWLADTVA